MNSRLVDQLRERAASLQHETRTSEDGQPFTAELLTEAADEIERLVADSCGPHGITIAQLTESRNGQHVE